MTIHTFCTHQKLLTYITAEGQSIIIPGTLQLDSEQHSALIKELTAIAEDPGSPIYIPQTASEAATSEAESETQAALVQELKAKAIQATLADKKGK